MFTRIANNFRQSVDLVVLIIEMISVGYMALRVQARPDWLRASHVVDVYSVCGCCISKHFAKWINFWRHNGWWWFDSPEIIRDVSREHGIDLAGTTLFFYEAYELEFDENDRTWLPYKPEATFKTNVAVPVEKTFVGYDVVTFSCRNSAECSPLSCNRMAEEIRTNEHCLLESFEDAKRYLEAGMFDKTEPGPFRIYNVNVVPWPS